MAIFFTDVSHQVVPFDWLFKNNTPIIIYQYCNSAKMDKSVHWSNDIDTYRSVFLAM